MEQGQGGMPEKVVSPLPGWKASAFGGAITGMGIEAVCPGAFNVNCEKNRFTRKVLMDKKLARLTRLFRVGGVPAGMSLGTIALVHNYLIEKRRVIDAYNLGVSLTYGYLALGLTAPRSPTATKAVMLASIFGGINTYALAWACFKILEKQGLNVNDFLKPSKK